MSSIAEFEGAVPLNYDRYLGPHLFEPYALDIIKRIDGLQPKKVLEIACGTGRVTRHLVEALPKESQLWATDLNKDMLQVAKATIDAPNINWQVADAQQLPFEKETFDLAICQFGVMFFPDRLQAFTEVYRVLKPGGRFIFNTWDAVEYNAATNSTQHALNDFFKGDAPQFIQKGPFSFFDHEEIKATLEKAGFNMVKLTVVPKQTDASAASDLVNGIVDGSPLTGYLKERGASTEAVKKRILEEFENDFIVNKTPMTMQAIVCEVLK